ncbi:uncharacterized [Tachysurus ichikawai]
MWSWKIRHPVVITERGWRAQGHRYLKIRQGVDLFAMLAKHQWSFQSWCDFSLGSVKCGCQQSPLRSAVRDGDAGWGEFVV